MLHPVTVCSSHYEEFNCHDACHPWCVCVFVHGSIMKYNQIDDIETVFTKDQRLNCVGSTRCRC